MRRLQVYKGQWCHARMKAVVTSLCLMRLQVYKGLWRNLEVAVKMVLFQAKGSASLAPPSFRSDPVFAGQSSFLGSRPQGELT